MSVVAGAHAMRTRSLTGKLWWLLPPGAVLLYPLAFRALHESGRLLHRTSGPYGVARRRPWTPPSSWMPVQAFFWRLAPNIPSASIICATARTGANEISSHEGGLALMRIVRIDFWITDYSSERRLTKELPTTRQLTEPFEILSAIGMLRQAGRYAPEVPSCAKD